MGSDRKRCPKCETVKDASEFGIRGGDRAGKGQLKSWCRRCEADRQATRQVSKDVRSKWPSQQLEHLAAKTREWRLANPEKARASARRSHPEARRRWRAKNGPAVQRERRAAALRKLKKGVMGREYGEILMADPCSYCGGSTEHVDHIDPAIHGGSSDWWNLTASCGFCNGSKKDKKLIIFLATRNTIGAST